MENFHYPDTLNKLWKKAVKQYKMENRDPKTFFSPKEEEFLSNIGITPQEMYDYAEDYTKYKEPSFATVALIQEVRREYFVESQKKNPSRALINSKHIPKKTDEIEGIPWLARLIDKGYAKLRGEIPSDIMFCCSGDRDFFKKNNIHPAEFLRAIWRSGVKKKDIVKWVRSRMEEAGASSKN